ncbi:g4853 [Coccomyxa elongata]
MRCQTQAAQEGPRRPSALQEGVALPAAARAEGSPPNAAWAGAACPRLAAMAHRAQDPESLHSPLWLIQPWTPRWHVGAGAARGHFEESYEELEARITRLESAVGLVPKQGRGGQAAINQGDPHGIAQAILGQLANQRAIAWSNSNMHWADPTKFGAASAGALFILVYYSPVLTHEAADKLYLVMWRIRSALLLSSIRVLVPSLALMRCV